MPDESTTRRNGGLEKREAGKRGYVYILINPAFAGFVKIGKTTKAPAVRAREVSAGSGVPAPYAVAWDALVGDCDQVERMIHQQLAPVRARKDREFFALPLKRAITIASGIAAPFACEGEESLPLCLEDSAVATILSDASIVEVLSSDKAVNLIAAWRTAYPEAQGARFLEKHSDFCSALTHGILALGEGIEISFDPRSVIFSDSPHGKRSFFGITPQLSQVLLAPLTLEVDDIRDLGLHAGQVRDLSNKKYKMGGLFRVEMAQDLEMEVALELARRSFASNRNIETWNLLRIRR
jgi:hypothetical protein